RTGAKTSQTWAGAQPEKCCQSLPPSPSHQGPQRYVSSGTTLAGLLSLCGWCRCRIGPGADAVLVTKPVNFVEQIGRHHLALHVVPDFLCSSLPLGECGVFDVDHLKSAGAISKCALLHGCNGAIALAANIVLQRCSPFAGRGQHLKLLFRRYFSPCI